MIIHEIIVKVIDPTEEDREKVRLKLTQTLNSLDAKLKSAIKDKDPETKEVTYSNEIWQINETPPFDITINYEEPSNNKPGESGEGTPEETK